MKQGAGADSSGLWLDIQRGFSNTPIGTGAYAVKLIFDGDGRDIPGPFGRALHHGSAACTTLNTNWANAGTITIREVTSDAVSGSFDLTFVTGDHMTGSFGAPLCAVSWGPPTQGACR